MRSLVIIFSLTLLLSSCTSIRGSAQSQACRTSRRGRVARAAGPAAGVRQPFGGRRVREAARVGLRGRVDRRDDCGHAGRRAPRCDPRRRDDGHAAPQGLLIVRRGQHGPDRAAAPRAAIELRAEAA